MEELSLISRQEPGIAAIDNFQELKQALEQQLEAYKSLAYSQDSVKAAKKDKAMLNKLKKAIDEKRKEIKRVYMQPYTVVEAQAKELIALIDEPLALIAAFIAREEAEEKEARRNDIAAYFCQNASALGELAESILHNSAFYDSKWENKSTTVKAYQTAIVEKGCFSVSINIEIATLYFKILRNSFSFRYTPTLASASHHARCASGWEIPNCCDRYSSFTFSQPISAFLLLA